MEKRPDVFFADARARSGRSLVAKTAMLFKAAGLGQVVQKGDLVAVKLHVGEPGNLAYLRPPIVRQVVELVKQAGGRPFITDANTLYAGGRGNAVDHMHSAVGNGFAFETIGAPFIVADGLRGHEHVKVPVNGKWVSEAHVASAIAQADAMIVLTHFKGHMNTGFGGAIKNMGMGCASRSGKQIQHSTVKPKVNPDRCKGCRRCVEWCPVGALEMTGDRKAQVNPDVCIGCAECTITCLHSAIAIQWAEGKKGSMQEKMAEYAAAVVNSKPGRCGFMNFLIDISPDCDCAGWSDAPVVPDIGILASLDPVAIDQASVDLVNKAPGLPGTALPNTHAQDKFGEIHSHVDWSVQLEHAQSLGLGSRAYNLREMEG